MQRGPAASRGILSLELNYVLESEVGQRSVSESKFELVEHKYPSKNDFNYPFMK